MMKQNKLRILILSVCALLIFGGTVKDVWAKYVKDTTLNGNITFQAEVGKITIKEYQAVQNLDGTYSLNMSQIVPDGGLGYNEYVPLPGVDIPRNAWVEVSDKSAIPAYVYIRVNGSSDPGDPNLIVNTEYGISYRMNDVWKKHSSDAYGTTYIYAPDGSIAKVTNDTENIDVIPILKDNTLLISHLTTNLVIDWFASMEQVAS